MRKSFYNARMYAILMKFNVRLNRNLNYVNIRSHLTSFYVVVNNVESLYHIRPSVE